MTAPLPQPDWINSPESKLPGPLWEPSAANRPGARRWHIRVVDPDDPPACVFITPPKVWDDSIYPLEPDEARRVAMALLAAADWADKVRTRELGEAS
ncbi:hypothetical protein [Microbispora triticiradicis]|uniref:hypothetical protein n=1 Tax=Microbispora triticiradicis TaxID=2200763 RepID=UPI001AD66A06|nr:hypothetical protein [Microbispora triticiradicis]MBO4273109.1 hypothetical protein [Microbispora triticiradicis]